MHLVVQAVIFGILIGGVYALMASGVTLVFGIMRVINVAQGAMVILGAYLSYSLFTVLGLDPFLSILLIGPAMFALGYLIHRRLHPFAAARERRRDVAARDLGDGTRGRGRAVRRVHDQLPVDDHRLRAEVVAGRRVPRPRGAGVRVPAVGGHPGRPVPAVVANEVRQVGARHRPESDVGQAPRSQRRPRLGHRIRRWASPPPPPPAPCSGSSIRSTRGATTT